jgi:uncharacterized membrane protein
MRVILFTTILLSGLVAGLLYAYSCSVNPGLKTLSDSEYVKAMQAINLAIQNPLFFISFMGLLVFLPITTFQFYGPQKLSFFLFAGAMIIYFVGVFGVTIFCNVPLNEQLAKFPVLTATQQEISLMRQAFEKPWNTYHTVRTLAAIISFGLTIFAITRQKL